MHTFPSTRAGRLATLAECSTARIAIAGSAISPSPSHAVGLPQLAAWVGVLASYAYAA